MSNWHYIFTASVFLDDLVIVLFIKLFVRPLTNKIYNTELYNKPFGSPCDPLVYIIMATSALDGLAGTFSAETSKYKIMYVHVQCMQNVH
jgi:hypothetical protein